MRALSDDIFRASEIKSVVKLYKFIPKKKVVVFIPSNHLEDVAGKLFNAGAGRIGNYDKCSFRINGTGTFRPNSKASPFSGKKNKVSYEDEVRLEVECDQANLNQVIDALLKHHPYEEPAYEVYDFRKRDKKPMGKIFFLNSKYALRDLLIRLNEPPEEGKNEGVQIDKVAIVTNENEANAIESAQYSGCQCLILKSKKKFKLIKINE